MLVQTRHSSKPVYASARLRLKALFCVVIAFIATKFLKQPFFALIALLPTRLNSNVAITSQIAEEAALTELSVRVTQAQVDKLKNKALLLTEFNSFKLRKISASHLNLEKWKIWSSWEGPLQILAKRKLHSYSTTAYNDA